MRKTDRRAEEQSNQAENRLMRQAASSRQTAMKGEERRDRRRQR